MHRYRKSQPKEGVWQTKPSFVVVLLLGWSEQEPREALVSTKAFLDPPSATRRVRRPRQGGELALPHNLAFLVSTTDYPYVGFFWYINLLLLLCLSPASLDLSQCTASCVPAFETESGVGFGVCCWKSEPTDQFCSCAKCLKAGTGCICSAQSKDCCPD